MANQTRTNRYEYTFFAEGVRLTMFINVTPYYYPLMQPLPQAGFHTHEWYEMFYVERGELHCYFEDQTILLRAGEFLIIKPGVRHYSEEKDASVVMYALPFTFSASAKCAVPWVSFLEFDTFVRFGRDLECTALAGFLLGAMQLDQELAVGNYLFALLSRAALLQNAEGGAGYALINESSIGRICKLDRILQKYFNNSNLELQFVADELHVSVRQLSRIIQKQYGCTYREKLLELRMIHAARLLSTELSITEISYEVGYSSLSAFHAAFSKYYGMAAAQYRKEKLLPEG